MSIDRSLIAIVILTIALAFVPLFITSDYWINMMIGILFFGFLGQSWNLVGGYAGQYSFGHAAFFGCGAYAMAILQLSLGWSPWIAMPVAGAIGAIVATGIGALSFRYGLRGSYFGLVTLAFAEIFRVLANSFAFTNGGMGLMLTAKPGIANLQFAAKSGYLYMILAMTAASLLMMWALERSRLGARMVALRESEAAAEALGVNVVRHKLIAMAISGAMAGLGGGFYVQYFFYLDPGIGFGVAKSVEMLLMPIVGGLGTLFGPLIGSAALHGLDTLTQRLFENKPGLNLALYGILLIVILRYMPQGLWGGFRQLFMRLFKR